MTEVREINDVIHDHADLCATICGRDLSDDVKAVIEVAKSETEEIEVAVCQKVLFLLCRTGFLSKPPQETTHEENKLGPVNEEILREALAKYIKAMAAFAVSHRDKGWSGDERHAAWLLMAMEGIDYSEVQKKMNRARTTH